MNRFKVALGFLTILPVSFKNDPEPDGLGKSAAWFPVVGLIIGLLTAGSFWLFSRLFPPLLSSALIVTVWVILTGGLHLDGLADCCDGFFASRSAERRLEIMRDPHLGTFGVIGLVLHLVLKITAVSSLTGSYALFGLLIAPVVARFLLLFGASFSSARSDGLGTQFKTGFNKKMVLLAAALPIILLVASGLKFLGAATFAALVAAAVLLAARKLIGGVTGDVLGMLVELTELGFLTVLSIRGL
jgi:adenosylcobinamide-GDP ribazoletransferase